MTTDIAADHTPLRTPLPTIERMESAMNGPARIDVDGAAPLLEALVNEIGTALTGKPDVIETAVVCILAEGHLLLDDVPGVGKTVLAKSIAATIGGHAARVQFTPDLLPADITGVSVWQPTKESFSFRPGPLFANVVVCDELNRGPAKTQSALLEAMEERAVTVDGTTYALARPFMVVATQNPFEQDGTYNLPESQIDRFLMRTAIGYPDRNSELTLLQGGGAEYTVPKLKQVLSTSQMATLTELSASIYVAPALVGYIADLVRSTRSHPNAALGASPRGSLSLLRASKAQALLRGRGFATPDDVRDVIHRVLDHRVLVKGSSRWNRTTSAAVVADALQSVPVPGGKVSGS
jgi:MoxR-like ATPase